MKFPNYCKPSLKLEVADADGAVHAAAAFVIEKDAKNLIELESRIIAVWFGSIATMLAISRCGTRLNSDKDIFSPPDIWPTSYLKSASLVSKPRVNAVSNGLK